MVNPEDLNRRNRMQENIQKQEIKEGKNENRQTQNNTPEVLTNPI